MSRTHVGLLVSVLSIAVAGCSKPAANQDTGTTTAKGDMGGGKVAVPGGEAPKMTSGMGSPEGTVGAKGGTTGDDPFRLKPEEGQLAVEAPKDVVAGAEFTAKILVTPVGPYKINKEFPTKLTFESAAGVTLAKAQLTAGGHDQVKGDADAFEDKQLAFTVRLTPTSGNHTINGVFKFAVCDKDTCLAKKEQISIVVAAK
ncbi:MAG: hypothetical protein H0T42_15685 [Deltaproteobacteria bacterium]|nr:hypothetical protein [Deltaproteobacteria bacterium]